MLSVGGRCTSCLSGALYRMVYDDCYPHDYALLRAAKSFGEKKYDIFEQNCEHSTTWSVFTRPAYISCSVRSLSDAARIAGSM